MTARRRNGVDSAFGEWVRSQRTLDSVSASLVVNDIDWIFHRYRIWRDRIGDRSVQLTMLVELKTNNSEPKKSQQEVMFFQHQLLSRKVKLKRIGGDAVSVWHFGVFFLSLASDRPVDGERMRWGRFNKNGQILWVWTNRQNRILDLLGFIYRPDRPTEKLTLRRHHTKGTIEAYEKTPIGIECWKTKKFSS